MIKPYHNLLYLLSALPDQNNACFRCPNTKVPQFTQVQGAAMIESIKAAEQLDSRGNPTVQVAVTTSHGT